MTKAQEATLRRANEIDEFIRDNSDISAEDYGSAYEACVTLVERERKKVIDEVCDYIKPYLYDCGERYSDADIIIAALRKAMEEQV